MAGKKRPPRRPPHKPSFASRHPQPSTADALVYTEYDITDEPLDHRDIKRLPAQVQARMDDLYELAQYDPMQAIPALERLMTTYLHIPTFANHLSLAYLAAGDQEQATACVREGLSPSSPVSLCQDQLREPVSSARGDRESARHF